MYTCISQYLHQRNTADTQYVYTHFIRHVWTYFTRTARTRIYCTDFTRYVYAYFTMPTNSTTLELPPQPRRNSACIYIFHKICIYIFHSDGYVQISPGMYLHTSPCQATQLRGKCRHNDSEKNHKEKGTHEAHSAAVGQAAFGKEIHSPLLDHPRAKHRRQDNTRDLHHDGHQ